MSLPNLGIPALFDVKGKVALVTGGGTGLGKAIAAALVQNGAKVYIAARKENVLKATTDELNAKGPGSVQYFTANLNTKAGCNALIEDFKKRETKLHILVNNSGVTWGAKFSDFDEPKGWDNLMSVNVKGIFYMIAGLSGLLIKDSTNIDPGRIINISSIAGLSPFAEDRLSGAGMGTYSYAVSKAAVNHLTSIMAAKFAKHHVTVNAILPGVFPTNMTSYGIKTSGADNMAAATPNGRMGTPEDIAGISLFLCSRASSHVTGAHIVVDGGTLVATSTVSPAKEKSNM